MMSVNRVVKSERNGGGERVSCLCILLVKHRNRYAYGCIARNFMCK